MSLYDLRHAADAPSLRFLAAQKGFTIQEAARHCCALANQGGGKLIFGLSPDRPRKVIGSHVFEPYEPVRRILQEQLHVRIEARTYHEGDKRVLVFSVSPGPMDTLVQWGGVSWGYEGWELVSMPAHYQRDYDKEYGADFTAAICKDADLDDLDWNAVDQFLGMWQERSQDSTFRYLSKEELLTDCGAITDDGVTYAALILFGRKESLLSLGVSCWTAFDFRPHKTDERAHVLEFFRSGLFSYYGNLRALFFRYGQLQDCTDGFDLVRLPAFWPDSAMEVFLNAVCHRDYRIEESIRIHMNWEELTVESPGGFPKGITANNLKYRQNVRNRLLTKLLTLSWLVKYSGQGMDVLYGQCLRDTRPLPDFTGTTDDTVVCTLRSAISDPKLVLAMQKFDTAALYALPHEALEVLTKLYYKKPIPASLRDSLDLLLERNLVRPTEHGYTFVSSPSSFGDDSTSLEDGIRALLSQSEQGLSTEAIQQALSAHWGKAIQTVLEKLQQAGDICRLEEGAFGVWVTR